MVSFSLADSQRSHLVLSSQALRGGSKRVIGYLLELRHHTDATSDA